MASLDRVRRIVFIRTDRLGETLLNLPAIAALRAALPKASVTLLANPALEPLLSRVPGVERVLPAPEGSWWGATALRTARLLWPYRFDLAIVSNPKKALHVGTWLAGIPVRVGYDRKWGGLLTHRVPDRKAIGERHEAEYNLDLLRLLDLPVAAPMDWQLPCGVQEEDDVRRLLEPHGVKGNQLLVAIHPWTSDPSKQWPLERFRDLLKAVAAQGLGRPVVVGGQEAVGQVPAILVRGAPLINFVGQLTLPQLAALLKQARVLVSNDSGPVHLAAAVATPAVVLFRADRPGGGPARWGPLGQRHTVIARPSLAQIGVDEVLAAVQRYLV